MATVFFLQNLRVTLYVIFSNLLDDPTHLVTKHKCIFSTSFLLEPVTPVSLCPVLVGRTC